MTWFTLGEADWLNGLISEPLYGSQLTAVAMTSYPDGETRLDLTDDPGENAVVTTRMFDPITGCFDMALFWALLGAATASRQHGCTNVVAIVPEIPCARQDRPTRHTFELAARNWVIELLDSSDVDALITLHPKPELAWTARRCRIIAPQALEIARIVAGRLVALDATIDSVVAPDNGSASFAEAFTELLACRQDNLAKSRHSAELVTLTGQRLPPSRGRLVVDDMYISGGTLLAAASLAAQSGPVWAYVSNFRPTSTGRERLELLLAMPGFRGLLIPAHHASSVPRRGIHPVGMTSVMDPIVEQALGLTGTHLKGAR